MKKMIQRKDVSKLLVSDDYFSEKHYLLKIRQTLVAIIGWMGVISLSYGFRSPLPFLNLLKNIPSVLM